MRNLVLHCFAACLIINVAKCFMFGGEAEWDDLSVTWRLNSLSSAYFDSLPRTFEDAKLKGNKLKVSKNRTLY